MTRLWPALDVRGIESRGDYRPGLEGSDDDRADLVLAIVDQFAPTAAEACPSGVRVFFASAERRDAAGAALAEYSNRYDVQVVDVPDEDWARRSQETLGPVTVGRITILPSSMWRASDLSRCSLSPSASSPSTPSPSTPFPSSFSPSAASPLPPVVLVIPPSMGFGTGHHASTRLCLAALQTLDLTDAFVLDVGTGSGVLALAAAALGARGALGIDRDPDAIAAARENLALNPRARCVSFEVADLASAPLPRADFVVANLTGELLVRAAASLAAALDERSERPGRELDRYAPPRLVLGGLFATERARVLAAFTDLEVVWEGQEEEWLGLVLG
jgi:ribosomal protein L11 methylase PrmA